MFKLVINKYISLRVKVFIEYWIIYLYMYKIMDMFLFDMLYFDFLYIKKNYVFIFYLKMLINYFKENYIYVFFFYMKWKFVIVKSVCIFKMEN